MLVTISASFDGVELPTVITDSTAKCIIFAVFNEHVCDTGNVRWFILYRLETVVFPDTVI